MTASINVKYDFNPALPSPGEDYDKFEERLLNMLGQLRLAIAGTLWPITSSASTKARPEAPLSPSQGQEQRP